LFPPTKRAKQNLLREGYDEKNIFVTGNTVIDALYYMVEKMKDQSCPIPEFAGKLQKFEKMVLITGHRRENFGEPLRKICQTFKKLSLMNPNVCFVYPVHLNPNVQDPVRSYLEGLNNFFLLPPLAYPVFIWFMQKASIIITDSGGIQEEAPALSKPVLVTRKVTERPEALDAGVLKIVGDDEDQIIENTKMLLEDPGFYNSMAKGVSPYGDGKASERIISILAGEKPEEYKL